MSRKNITGQTIAVDADGELLVWTDGHISGSAELVKKARYAANIELPVDITFLGPTVIAELDNAENPAGALAAMLSVTPGRGRILDAPKEVLDLLPEDFEDTDEDDDALLEALNELTPEELIVEGYPNV
jgi:hypothetical protein